MEDPATDPDAARTRTSLTQRPPAVLVLGLVASALLVALVLSAIGGPSVGALEPGPFSFEAALSSPNADPQLGADVPGLSFVDNLLAKEADGEWTRGEGLVATLEHMAGIRDARGVLRAEVDDDEATGIVQMAMEYVAAGADAATLGDLERLLDIFVWDHERLEAMVAEVQDVQSLARPDAINAALVARQANNDPTDCQQFYLDQRLPTGVAECLIVSRISNSGISFSLYHPVVFEPPFIWDEIYFGLVKDTIAETIAKPFLVLGSMPPTIDIVLSAMLNPANLAEAVPQDDGAACTITLFTNLIARTDAEFKQTLAHEFGHCFQNATMPDQQLEYSVRKWREEGFAEYLGAVAYPGIDMEVRFVETFVRDELTTTTVRTRDYRNFVFFQYLYQTWGSDEAIINFLRTGPTSGDLDEQEDFLRGVPNMAELHHGLTRTMTDVELEDRNGGFYILDSKWSVIADLTEAKTYAANIKPFGAARFHLVVPAGKVASAQLVSAEGLDVSYRAVTDEWTAMPSGSVEWRAECEEPLAFFVVATGIEEAAPVTIDVTVRDIPEGDCDTAEAIDRPANAECLVGSWAASLSFMRDDLIADSVSGMKVGNVSGTMTMTLEQGGAMTSSVNRLRVRTLAPFGSDPDRVLTTMVWDGGGSGTWSADDTTFRTSTSAYTLDLYVVSKLDGEVILDNKQPLPIDQTSAFQPSGDARYDCSGDQLVIEGAEGASVWWYRANKANTIPKG